MISKDNDNTHCHTMNNHLDDSFVDYSDNDWHFSKFLKRRKTADSNEKIFSFIYPMLVDRN